MTLHQLRVFSSVAKYLNLTKAAKELRVSQPSVSQQLRLLEDQTGGKLYQKVGQGIRLTEQGLEFLKAVEPALIHLERLEGIFKNEIRSHVTRTLTVGSSHTATQDLLPAVLTYFKGAHPDVQIVFDSNTSPVIEESVIRFKYEIGVIFNPSYDPALRYQSFGKRKVVFAVSNTDPRARTGKISLRDLAHAPLVVPRPLVRGDIPSRMLEHLEKHGIRPNIVFQTESPAALRTAIREGVGIGPLLTGPGDPWERYMAVIDVPELPTLSFEGCIISSKNRILSSHAQEFLNLLHAEAGIAELGGSKILSS